MYLCDLHIHSRFSRATSKECDMPHLQYWARKKGIQLIGTGDFTHPAWRAELKEHLQEAEEGLYTLREEFRLKDRAPEGEPRFVITGEISSIYQRAGKTRKVHNLILLPSLQAADELSAKLEAIGNIHSDGRPILGLDSRDLLELTLETCPEAELIPAHIWTPHFSMFGAFSDFSCIEECFDDLAPHIHAVETGLSSDPPMNWRVSALQGKTLISNSDAHSPAKLGREANLLDAPMTYPGLLHAIRTGQGFAATIEFFPEEGKYHLDGHRNCGICLTPAETEALGGICPVCGKKLTIGVEHRVEELSDCPEGFRPNGAKPYESLVPLPEVIAASTGISATGKKAGEQYERMIEVLGPEFHILRKAKIEEIERIGGPCIAEGIRRLRAGQVERRAGFDGEYGTISLLTPAEREQLQGQLSLFGAQARKEAKKAPRMLERAKKAGLVRQADCRLPEGLNREQQSAACSEQQTIAVIAGPGTGKTKTLVARIAHLVEQGVQPSEITAVTFTHQAADEMRTRLQTKLGKKRMVDQMTIGTFHAICLKLLGTVRLISQSEAFSIAEELLDHQGKQGDPQKLVRGVSCIKNGMSYQAAGIEKEWYQQYCAKLEALGVLDFDDLLLKALQQGVPGRQGFAHLLVDEFQDINDMQYALLRSWSQGGKSLFVIGDPDQSIYGFRGANGRCFERLLADFPDTQVIRLVENYRSSPEILQAALQVIEKNPGGSRECVPNCHSSGPVRLMEAEDVFSEAVLIAKEIAGMTGGVDMLEAQRADQERKVRAFSDIAVLCRTHRQLELIETCLQHDDIPCIVVGREAYLDSIEVRGVLAFFRSLQEPRDSIARKEALQRIWNCPMDLIQMLQGRCESLDDFDLKALQDAVQGHGYLEEWFLRAQEWLPLVKTEKPWRLIARWEERYGESEALQHLKNMAVFYPSFQGLWNAWTLGEEADLRRASGKGWESGAVRLMTLHGAKGLEFPAVLIAGIRAGILPMESQSRPADREEERRLLYVGMTRAKEELILTTTTERSEFLDDLPECVIQERSGQRLRRASEQLRWF